LCGAAFGAPGGVDVRRREAATPDCTSRVVFPRRIRTGQLTFYLGEVNVIGPVRRGKRPGRYWCVLSTRT